MTLFLANSLLDGFLLSNGIGKGIVAVQLLFSVAMFAVIIGKWRELKYAASSARRFRHDFAGSGGVLEYYMSRRPSVCTGPELIYKETCEALMKVVSPGRRSLLAGHDEGASALTKREIGLVESACESILADELTRVERAMPVISTTVALSPMLGLLGTVWGVLDAFADMGTAGSANLASIAPSISSALVTTVVGLIIAIPGVCFYDALKSKIGDAKRYMEGFADELTSLIACEYQGSEA